MGIMPLSVAVLPYTFAGHNSCTISLTYVVIICMKLVNFLITLSCVSLHKLTSYVLDMRFDIMS